MQAELILDARATLAEGPVWDDRSNLLYWTDISGGILHATDTANRRDRMRRFPFLVGCLAVRDDGGLILAADDGFRYLDGLDAYPSAPIWPPDECTANRFNDGKCDPAGRFWASTMNPQSVSAAGSLYVLAGGKIERRLSGLTIPNGLSWSLEKQLFYFTDSPTRQILAFDYDASTGEIANRRVAIETPAGLGVPDGFAIDAHGRLWVAHWGGGCVGCWDPSTGENLATVQVPAPHVSSCAFGGSGMDELFITTAREDLDESQLKRWPHSGGIFRARVGTVGRPADRFRG